MATAPNHRSAREQLDRAAECVEEAARLVAANPGAVEHLLARHRPDPLGRCTGCGQVRPHWPCTLVAVAERARTPTAPALPTTAVVVTGPGRAPTPRRRPR